MTHASLYSGQGGFDLAAQWAGFVNLLNCEIDPFCKRSLKFYWPNAEQYGRIQDADFTAWRGLINVLSAGFPCQPSSVAGQRMGTADHRWLWPDTRRAIDEIRPDWVVLENVAGLLSMVQPGDEVEVGCKADLFGAEAPIYESVERYLIDGICRDLEQIGYEVQSFLIPACAVGAPHRRDRVWIVGCLKDAERVRRDGSQPEEKPRERKQWIAGAGENERVCGEARIVTYSDGINSYPRRPEPTGQLRSTRVANGGQPTPNNTDTGREGVSESENEIYASSPITNAKRYRGDKIHKNIQSKQSEWDRADSTRCKRNVTDPKGRRLSKSGATWRRRHGFENDSPNANIPNWDNFPTQSPVRRRDDGFSSRLDREAVFEGVKPSKRKSTIARWSEESIKGFGNAIVPLVPLQIFETIKRIEAAPDRGITQ